ncbi:MAG: hypothetical protein LBC94_04910, partial [Desulfovibrio sp.]|nr:hypothetical protein [Desulfovibrio sp.]
CGKALASREGKYGRWWGCTGFFEGCDFKADDAGGEPKILVCPDCGQFLKSGSNDRGAYTVCRNVAGHIDGLNHFFDENGKLREKHESTLVPNGEFKCPECGRPLSYILQKKGKDAGKPVFACFNKEGHGGNVLFYKDDAGAPVF